MKTQMLEQWAASHETVASVAEAIFYIASGNGDLAESIWSDPSREEFIAVIERAGNNGLTPPGELAWFDSRAARYWLGEMTKDKIKLQPGGGLPLTQYGWIECVTPMTPDKIEPHRTQCGNTVKFGIETDRAVCPACGTYYRRFGDDRAIKI